MDLLNGMIILIKLCFVSHYFFTLYLKKCLIEFLRYIDKKTSIGTHWSQINNNAYKMINHFSRAKVQILNANKTI